MVEAAWAEVRTHPQAFVAAAASGFLLAIPTLFTWCWPLAFVALVPYLTASRSFTLNGRARTGLLLGLVLATAWYGTALYWFFALARYHWTAVPGAFLMIALGLSEFLIVPVSLRLVHRRV